MDLSIVLLEWSDDTRYDDEFRSRSCVVIKWQRFLITYGVVQMCLNLAVFLDTIAQYKYCFCFRVILIVQLCTPHMR